MDVSTCKSWIYIPIVWFDDLSVVHSSPLWYITSLAYNGYLSILPTASPPFWRQWSIVCFIDTIKPILVSEIYSIKIAHTQNSLQSHTLWLHLIWSTSLWPRLLPNTTIHCFSILLSLLNRKRILSKNHTRLLHHDNHWVQKCDRNLWDWFVIRGCLCRRGRERRDGTHKGCHNMWCVSLW